MAGALSNTRDTLCGVDAAFYFDLASPLAYLAAERVLQVIPGPLEWRPVLARELPGAETSNPSAARRRCRCSAQTSASRRGAGRCSRCAGPSHSRSTAILAMRVAHLRKGHRTGGPVRAGRLPPSVCRRALALRSGHRADRRRGLRDAPPGSSTRRASSLRARAARNCHRGCGAGGVGDVPAVLTESIAGDRVLVGERALEEAGELLAGAAAR